MNVRLSKIHRINTCEELAIHIVYYMRLYNVNLVIYNRFVQKIYTLDPATDAIPWNSRGYSRKRKALSDQCREVKRLQLVAESDTTGDEAGASNLKDFTCGRCVINNYSLVEGVS